MSFFKYFSLGSAVFSAVPEFQAAFSHTPIFGSDIADAARPVLIAVKAAFSKVSVPDTLVVSVAAAVADAVNTFYKKVH